MRLEMPDYQGRTFHGSQLQLSEYGTIHDTVRIDRFAPLGGYSVSCTDADRCRSAPDSTNRVHQWP